MVGVLGQVFGGGVYGGVRVSTTPMSRRELNIQVVIVEHVVSRFPEVSTIRLIESQLLQ